MIAARSLTLGAKSWLQHTRQPRILHIFERACSVMSERGEVVSLVNPDIGDGPLNVVLEQPVCFSECVDLNACIAVDPAHFTLGPIVVRTDTASLWNPRPNWDELHAKRDQIADQLLSLQGTFSLLRPWDTAHAMFPRMDSTISIHPQLPAPGLRSLARSLSSANLSASITAARRLAGLGVGLTPAADDFLMGAVYAAWILHPAGVAADLAREVASAAAPLTSSLSATWLRAAGRGEAGALWHEFFIALAGRPDPSIAAMRNLLAVGETSGACALSGFMGTMTAVRKATDPH